MLMAPLVDELRNFDQQDLSLREHLHLTQLVCHIA
jgi:hypothetical protein